MADERVRESGQEGLRVYLAATNCVAFWLLRAIAACRGVGGSGWGIGTGGRLGLVGTGLALARVAGWTGGTSRESP